jgi:hypothetical protein
LKTRLDPLRRSHALLALALLVGATGCAPADPLERIVAARTPDRFATWRAHITSDSSRETRRSVEEALQEIRLSIAGERELKRAMGEPVVGGSEKVDEAVRQRVDGRPLREVLQLGYELRARRLKEELAGLEDALSKNAKLVTRPGDLDSRHHLEGLRERQLVRVEKYRADIAAAERELAPLVAKTGRRLIESPTDTPDEMPVPIEKIVTKKKLTASANTPPRGRRSFRHGIRRPVSPRPRRAGEATRGDSGDW